MKNTLVAKSMIVGIIILCIGASSVTAYTTQMNPQIMGRGILYVGGAGPGNYTTIQEAIDNCTSGDTIFVYAGTYAENVDTKLKKITLLGEDRDTTIVQGQTTNPVVRIGNSDTSIEEFTLMGNNDETIILVATLCENVFISHNLIKNGMYGIDLQVTTSRVTIYDNKITDNIYIGIQMKTSTYNVIEENSIENNGAQGIDISLNSHHNSVLNNTITGNGEEGIAISGIASTENSLQGNDVSDNKLGIRFNSAGTNEVIGNNIEGNAMEGLMLQASSENNVERNNFIDNKRQATFKLANRNVWDANYWSTWIGVKFSAPIFQKFPKVILGGIRMNFDKNPALVPYNISVVL